MKTQVTQFRGLDGFPIRQTTKDYFFNATDLVNAYNQLNPGKEKRLDKYFELGSVGELIQAVGKDVIKNSNPQDSGYLKNQQQLLLPDLVDVNMKDLVMKTKRGNNGGTWVHPYIFLDIAMWLSVDFKVMCYGWLYDNLIKFRDEAGDNYKLVTAAIADTGESFIEEAKMMNQVVFGYHLPDIRRVATEEQLKNLNIVQKANAKYIREGFNIQEREQKLTDLLELIG